MSSRPDPATVCARLLHRAHFLVSATSARDCPPDQGIEIAFAGRSNAGKSSALNALVQQGSLARTSKTPGRTQLINFFAIDEQRRLVDLPGYGYAKVSAGVQARWQEGLEDYFQHRQSLAGIVLVMDIRHPLTDFDQMMLDASLHRGLKIHCLLTKADKLSRGAMTSAALAVERELRHWPGATAQAFSATAKTGIEKTWTLLGEWLQLA
ncbi:MAG: ribosome biogenesis GTP-binding protein YihA/YsxC [Pseudomonadota bacterium]